LNLILNLISLNFKIRLYIRSCIIWMLVWCWACLRRYYANWWVYRFYL